MYTKKRRLLLHSNQSISTTQGVKVSGLFEMILYLCRGDRGSESPISHWETNQFLQNLPSPLGLRGDLPPPDNANHLPSPAWKIGKIKAISHLPSGCPPCLCIYQSLKIQTITGWVSRIGFPDRFCLLAFSKLSQYLEIILSFYV